MKFKIGDKIRFKDNVEPWSNLELIVNKVNPSFYLGKGIDPWGNFVEDVYFVRCEVELINQIEINKEEDYYTWLAGPRRT